MRRRASGWILLLLALAGVLYVSLCHEHPDVEDADRPGDTPAQRGDPEGAMRLDGRADAHPVPQPSKAARSGGTGSGGMGDAGATAARSRVQVTATLDGKPAGRVRFALWDQEDTPRILLELTTDASGRAQADVEDLDYLAVAVATDGLWVRSIEDERRRRLRRFEVDLAMGVPLTLHVIDGVSGRGVGGAAVEVHSDPGAVWIGTTRDDGSLAVPAVPRDAELYVITEPSGYQQGELGIRIADGRAFPAEPRVLVRRGAEVEGQVVDAAGAPVRGALVRVASARAVAGLDALMARTASKRWAPGEAPPAFADPWSRAGAWTDAEGGFRLTGLDPGRTYRLKAFHTGRDSAASPPVQVGGRGARVLLRLRDGAGLRVELRDAAGERYAGNVRVIADQGSPGTLHRLVLGDGRCEFGPIPARPTIVRAAAEGLLGEALRVDLEPAGEHEVVLTVVEGGAIEGRVVDAEGHGVAGAMAYCKPAGARPHRGYLEPWSCASARTDANGRFRIAGLPHRAYWVQAMRKVQGEPMQHSTAPRAVIAPATGVRLVLHPPATATLRLLTPQGVPFVGRVDWTLRGPRHHGAQEEVADGRLELRDVFPGTYELALEAFGHPRVLTPLVAQRGEQAALGDIRIPTGVSITIRVTTEQGAPIPLADLAIDHRFTSNMQTDADGRYSTQPVVPGALAVGVQAEGYESCDLVCDVTTIRELSIALRKAWRHTGRLLRAGGGAWTGKGRVVLRADPLPLPQGARTQEPRVVGAAVDGQGRFSIPAGRGVWTASLVLPGASVAEPLPQRGLGTWVIAGGGPQTEEFVVPDR